MKKLITLIFLIFQLINWSDAQTPFVCDGSFYLALGTGNGSTIYRVNIDNNTGNVLFNSLGNNTGLNINSIGYRITDNLIYGLHPSNKSLYRIDATGQATIITTITGLLSQSFIAGDVTPDGDTLIVLGSVNGRDQTMHKIELSSGNYTVTSLNLTAQSSGVAPTVRSADISIDPFTGKIYGFANNRLITYDRVTGNVDDVSFPLSPIANTFGATFFDAFGNLKAYGQAIGGSIQETFFNIDKNTGIVTAVTTGPSATQNDGCSCPYTIKIQKTTDTDTIPQCGKIIFNFEIVNTSGIPRTGIDLQDVMPPEFTATQIISNPLGGTVTGIGTNTLNITDMNVPIGNSTIRVEAQVSNTALGTYFNQAILFDLPAALGSTAVSDYPVTVLENDPTPITVIPHSMIAIAAGDTSICYGASSALLSAQPQNTTSSTFSYSWSPAATLSNTTTPATIATPSGTTVYSVTITDSEGCFASDDVTVTIDTLAIFLGNDTTICINDSVLLDASYPALQGLQYLWNDGSTDTTYWAPGTGTYWVRVTDACGNISSDTINITESYTNVLTSTGSTPVSCFGGSDGTADVDAIQGTMPFTYLWSNNFTTRDIAHISVGTYKVTVTDVNGCRNINQVDVQQPPEIITVMTLIDSASCFSDASGSASVVANGGVGNFSYAWNTIPTETSSIATQLFGPSTYMVTVTDGNACIKIDTIHIPSPLPLTLSTFSSGTKCFGQDDADGIATPSGGTPNYTYQWDINAANQTTDTAYNLASETYLVTVTDYNGCVASAALTVGEALPMIQSFGLTLPKCNNDANGLIEISTQNGKAPYSYNWSNQSVGNIITDLASNQYTVTVTDSLGCEKIDSVFLPQPNVLGLDVQSTDLSCFGSRDGQFYMLPIGGTPVYEYSIDGVDFSNANIIYGLDAGAYPITIRDSFDCEFNTFAYLFEPAELIVEAGPDLQINQGDSTILAAATSFPSDSLLFIWEEQFALNTLSCDTCEMPLAMPLTDMFYTVTVIDSNGCEVSDGLWVRVEPDHTIFVPTGFTPNNDLVNDVFILHGKAGSKVLTFKVFDRWGEMVFANENFEVNDISAGWNGSFKGKMMDMGIFSWTAEVEFSDRTIEFLKGNVTLIR